MYDELIQKVNLAVIELIYQLKDCNNTYRLAHLLHNHMHELHIQFTKLQQIIKELEEE